MFINQILSNRSIWIGVLAWAIAQILKIILTYIQIGKMDFERMFGAGGMPSSHTALITAVSVSVGKRVGFGDPIFAVSAVLSMIVMYDAVGVRRAAGQQAKAINMLFNWQGFKLEQQLKELLGHTPLQVFCGALLGISLGIVIG